MSTEKDVAAAKQRVADWVTEIRSAIEEKRESDSAADSQSLERAADLEAIYNSFDWVQDMPPAPARRLGRRINPKSREQFAKWVKLSYGWGSQSYLNRLQASLEVATTVLMPRGMRMPSGSKALRPLEKLRAAGYADQQAQIWERAVELAEGETPTEGMVRKVVNEYLAARRPSLPNVAKDPRTKAEIKAANRARIVAEFHALMEEDNREAKETLNAMIQDFKEHQDVLTDERQSA